uniref:Uncharacterized protein n=1 Tax=Trichobilharzia regenti TaxID=157069 RepID=A0AA85JWE7_TRIRE|nr:unnamed protein product [Trichobilharzia regenti]
MTSSHRSGREDHRMEVRNAEHVNGEMEVRANTRQSNVSDKMTSNSNLNNDDRKIIEDGFPLLLETSRTECTEGENKNLTTAVNLLNGKCSPRDNVEGCLLQIKNQSNSNINQNGHTGNNDIMEKYLRLSLDNQSKSPIPEQNNGTVQSKLTNGFHSVSPKSNIRSWFENNHNFSSSESDISLNKTRNGHFTPLESLNNHEKIQNGDEVDSGSDYIW